MASLTSVMKPSGALRTRSACPGTMPLQRSIRGVAASSAASAATSSRGNSVDATPILGIAAGVRRCARMASIALQKVHRSIEQASKDLPPGWSPSSAFAMAALVPCCPGGLSDLQSNRVFMSGLVAFLAAQIGKIFTERYKKGFWDIKHLVAAGGMPSSHSSLCCGVTTALAMTQGLGSPVFACATAFTLVVMYDAMGVRRHAGMHAQVLNRVVYEISDDVSLGSIADMQLKEVLGHTPRQVICGALLGIFCGIMYPTFF